MIGAIRAGCLFRCGGLIERRIIGVMRMVVMAARCRHCLRRADRTGERPRGLDRQQNDQQEGDETAHVWGTKGDADGAIIKPLFDDASTNRLLSLPGKAFA